MTLLAREFVKMDNMLCFFWLLSLLFGILL